MTPEVVTNPAEGSDSKLVERGAFVGADDGEIAGCKRGAEAGEGGLDGGGGIAVARKVREVDAAPRRTRDGSQELAHRLVGKMTVAAGDALLGGPGALGVGLEQFGAVVGFDDDDIAGAEVFADMLRGVAEIGQENEGTAR